MAGSIASDPGRSLLELEARVLVVGMTSCPSGVFTCVGDWSSSISSL